MKGGKLEVGIGKGLELDDIVEAYRAMEENMAGEGRGCVAGLSGVGVPVGWSLASLFGPYVVCSH